MPPVDEAAEEAAKLWQAPPLGFPSGIIRQNWNDTDNISMAPMRKDDTHESRSAKLWQARAVEQRSFRHLANNMT